MPGWQTFRVASLGSLLLWLAQPPLGWWLLAWLAPLPWVRLVLAQQLSGTRPYGQLWLAGMLYWLLAVYWICLPHPATSIGWAALSMYLGVYLPVFVGLSRVAVHRLHVPANVACAVVWTGLELVQAHLLSGFHMAALSHTQFRWLRLIQISDLAGCYAVSSIVMFVAASLAMATQVNWKHPRWQPLVAATLVIAAALGYGTNQLAGTVYAPELVATLIQGSIDMRVVSSAEEYQAIRERMESQYLELTTKALAAHPDTDLIIWPETMVTESLVSFDDDVTQLDGRPVSREQMDLITRLQREKIGAIAKRFNKPMLLGVDVWRYTSDRAKRYNSVVLVDADGTIRDEHRYDKMHPVMFGEYIPFADQIPLLYALTPLTGGIEWGVKGALVPVRGREGNEVLLSPSICYESVLPHVIRKQVRVDVDQPPQVLVNLTNDGWFRGSAELDMHLVCGVFRAIENHKPMLIAANTGFSAAIDPYGRILQQGGRGEPGWLVAPVQCYGSWKYTWKSPHGRSWYSAVGDLWAGACLAASMALAAVAIRRRKPAAVGS